MCFAFSLNELGCTDVIQMDITDTGQPVASRPYRASATERETISRIVKEWKDVGIVTETNSPYASPVLLVTKKDGDARLVVDYRKLNSQTVCKVFPTPNLDDHLESLHGAKVFTTLDLASGYLQVPLTESAKEKTAFVTPNESGQFERMVFGLINAPYEFSRLMQRIMSPLRDKVAMWYLDDILIPSTSCEDMFNRLKQVFEVLKEAKLTLKLSKCYFAYSEVTIIWAICCQLMVFDRVSGKCRPYNSIQDQGTNMRCAGSWDYAGSFVGSYHTIQKWPDQSVNYSRLRCHMNGQPCRRMRSKR